MKCESPLVSAIIPAYREGERIAATVHALDAALRARFPDAYEILVIDDGSPDDTAHQARGAGAIVTVLPRNLGKGGALTAGLNAARGSLLLMLDADLEGTAREAVALLDPLVAGDAEMTIAVLPALGGGGFGFVMRLARWGLRRAGSPLLQAPLSGQRGLTRSAWERIAHLEPGFGLEMGLNLDAARLGLRVVETPVNFHHRVTGRNLAGFRHRGRQFRDILLVLWRRGLLRPGAFRGA